MPRKLSSPRVCVLLSGGIDSTACLHFYKDAGSSLEAVFIDYGQRSAERELLSTKKVAQHYDIRLHRLAWHCRWKNKTGLIVGRNMFFLAAAMMEMSAIADVIGIGIHSGTNYFDCSSSFLRLMKKIASDYSQGSLQIGAPFISWHKKDIWDYCRSSGVPLDLTYSCEYGLRQPCGKCPSCRELEALYASS